MCAVPTMYIYARDYPAGYIKFTEINDVDMRLI